MPRYEMARLYGNMVAVSTTTTGSRATEKRGDEGRRGERKQTGREGTTGVFLLRINGGEERGMEKERERKREREREGKRERSIGSKMH